MEEWKDIPGYEGKYQASTLGRIRSLDRTVNSRNHYTKRLFMRRIRGVVLRPGRYCKSGHVSVMLGRNTAGKPVHQLVMRTFAGETPKGMEIRHKNGNPQDNRLENLHFGTRTENILDVYYQGGVWRKLSICDVQEVRTMLAMGVKGVEIAKKFHVSERTISAIKTGKTFKWLK